MRAILTTIVLGVLAAQASAEVITAASCSRDDVGAAVQRADAGDVVTIPTGRCAWDTTLVVKKSITLRGENRESTILMDDVPKNPSGSTLRALMRFDAANEARLSNLTIEGLAPDTDNNNHGHVQFGDSSDIRVDHVTFRPLLTTGVAVSGRTTGVVDHCLFDGNHESGVTVAHPNWDGGYYGDSSWATPPTMGTVDALYIEDCEFLDRQSSGGGVTLYAGGRGVVRHSFIFNGGVYVSGTASGGRFRGGRHLELYANRFAATAQFAAVNIGSGTAVIFDNSFEGPFNSLVRLEVVRTRSPFTPWGQCNGAGAYDQNAEDGGYACLDGVGRGEGNLLGGDAMPVPMSWPQQKVDPVRLWNNSSDAGKPLVTVVTPSVIALGRDYLEGVPRPNYQPFVYPHPLVTRDEPDAGLPDGGVTADAGTLEWRLTTCGATAAGSPWVFLGMLALATLTTLRRTPKVSKHVAKPSS